MFVCLFLFLFCFVLFFRCFFFLFFFFCFVFFCLFVCFLYSKAHKLIILLCLREGTRTIILIFSLAGITLCFQWFASLVLQSCFTDFSAGSCLLIMLVCLKSLTNTIKQIINERIFTCFKSWHFKSYTRTYHNLTSSPPFINHWSNSYFLTKNIVKHCCTIFVSYPKPTLSPMCFSLRLG